MFNDILKNPQALATILSNPKTILEICILWYGTYKIFLFLKGTKAVYLLRGLIFLVLAFSIFQLAGLFVLSYLLTKLLGIYLILIIVIFQPELREGLIRLGKGHLFPLIEPRQEDIERTLRAIKAAAENLSRKKHGALIAMKKEIGLKSYIESGVAINSEISAELLGSIFYPSGPLHDGGVIVEGSRIAAAACLFPLSDDLGLDKTLGMRHRCGLGLSEHSDALVIIVSEETGTISLAINGQLSRDLSPDDLYTILKGQLVHQR